ncbi:MAG: LVIVD repeat-containing protein [Flavisolibacter sp.]
MKKFLLPLVLCTLPVIFFLQGCLKDTYTKTYTYTYYQPIYQTKDEVRLNVKSNTPQKVERPGKIYIRGNYLFLNEIDKGIHVIDNSNPSAPNRIAFITIPGNVDMAVKGNTLYADMYSDVLAIDISDPSNVVLKKAIDNIFPYRIWGGNFIADQNKIIVGWEERDTIIKEKHDVDNWLNKGHIYFALSADGSRGNSGSAAISKSPYGVGGSMSRFALAKERLYTVGEVKMDVFNITNSINPVKVNETNIGMNIETVYPFRDKLFIGSQTGMFIYNINNPDAPTKEGQFAHVRTCDPVIADDKYAYVTLRSGSACVGFTNQLEILNLNNISNPTLVKTYLLTNPHGLSKDGNTLFICDGRDGLKIFDASNVSDIKLINRIHVPDTYDIIAYNGNALLVAKDGLYQYDYTDLQNIKLRSKIELSK